MASTQRTEKATQIECKSESMYVCHSNDHHLAYVGGVFVVAPLALLVFLSMRSTLRFCFFSLFLFLLYFSLLFLNISVCFLFPFLSTDWVLLACLACFHQIPNNDFHVFLVFFGGYMRSPRLRIRYVCMAVCNNRIHIWPYNTYVSTHQRWCVFDDERVFQWGEFSVHK